MYIYKGNDVRMREIGEWKRKGKRNRPLAFWG